MGLIIKLQNKQNTGKLKQIPHQHCPKSFLFSHGATGPVSQSFLVIEAS
jgi:hypothetical protein